MLLVLVLACATLIMGSIPLLACFDLTCYVGADPQQRLSMSEEAAAAVELDEALDKGSPSKALDKASPSKARKGLSDSARPEPNNFHVLNGAANGDNVQKELDAASQAADKVGGDTLCSGSVLEGGGRSGVDATHIQGTTMG